jgi:hypothetical protein
MSLKVKETLSTIPGGPAIYDSAGDEKAEASKFSSEGILAQDKRWMHFKYDYYLPILRRETTIAKLLCTVLDPDRAVLKRIFDIYLQHVQSRLEVNARRAAQNKAPIKIFTFPEEIAFMIPQKESRIVAILTKAALD